MNLSKKVSNSPPIRQELMKLCAENNVKEQVLLRSVPTRWNSVAEMLVCALTLQPLLFSLCDMAQFNKQDGVWLHRFILEDNEWELLKQLHSLLDMSSLMACCMFADMIMIAFCVCYEWVIEEQHPANSWVIPFMDSLFDALKDYVSDKTLFPAVHMAAVQGCSVMQKYYGKTDDSIIYHIAMSPFLCVVAFPSLILYILPFQSYIPHTRLSIFIIESGPKNGLILLSTSCTNSGRRTISWQWRLRHMSKLIPTGFVILYTFVNHY